MYIIKKGLIQTIIWTYQLQKFNIFVKGIFINQYKAPLINVRLKKMQIKKLNTLFANDKQIKYLLVVVYSYERKCIKIFVKKILKSVFHKYELFYYL